MAGKYDHKKIEAKWQKRWLDERVFVSLPSGASRHLPSGRGGDAMYVLDMFPYPSGDGLHVGHPEGYTATDIYSRYLRMKGVNVLHPMGWDAFGLPAENAAIQKKTHPRIVTEQNIKNFKRQIRSIGFSYDWDREINTTDPKYYKWTQWIFLQLFKQGLAYEAELPIWWCPKDKTGLANEEVVGGVCDRCGTKVEKKMLRQWVLKITAYAEQLLRGLDKLDWPESIKTLQRNWIGRSEGAEVKFQIPSTKSQKNSKSKLSKPLAIIVHGSPSSFPYENPTKRHWLPWLASQLQERGYNVVMPEMPSANAPIFSEWKIALEKAMGRKKIPKNTVLVGHSAGSAFVTRYLSETGQKAAKLVLVAAAKKVSPLDPGEEPRPENIRKILTEFYDFDIRSGIADNKLVIYSTDDKSRHVASCREYASQLHAEVQELCDRGHFTYIDKSREMQTEIPEVLDWIAPKNEVAVFTTRPDTLFGATYLVLSPEHPLVVVITTPKQKKAVAEYIKKVASKSDLERTALEKEKTGVFTGAFAVNPVNNEKIPVWIADYVLMSYGTGAIMAVPAHDERDFAFARKFDLPIREVIQPLATKGKGFKEGVEIQRRLTVVCVIKHWGKDEYLCLKWKNYPWQSFVIGGTDGEDPDTAARREVREETGFKNIRSIRQLGNLIHAKYFAEHKNKNHWANIFPMLVELSDGNKEELAQSESALHELVWLKRREVEQFINFPDHQIAWQRYMYGDQAYVGEGIMTNSGEYNDLESYEGRKKIVSWLEKQGKGRPKTQYKLRDWIFSRQRYWGEPIPLVKCGSCKLTVESTPHYINFYNQQTWQDLLDGKKTVETRALNPEEPKRYFGNIKPENYIKGVFKPTGAAAYFRVKKVKVYKSLDMFFADKPALAAAAPDEQFKTVKELESAYEKLAPGYAEKIKKNGLIAFEVRHVLPGIILVPEKELPLVLPDIEKYEPTGTGESPLAAVKDWVNVTCRVCSQPAKRETNTMPQWAGSCWYYIRFTDPHNDQAMASDDAMKAWLPVDLYVGGAEHAVLHLLYARFWHMVLYDVGAIPKEVGDEPFVKLRNQGLILGPDGEKMSKSRGNVINPDEIIAKYGADTLRMYEMFMGPFADAKPWDTNGIVGVRRFLDKVWRVTERLSQEKVEGYRNRLLHTSIKFVTEDIEQFKFNTAVSTFMGWLNAWSQDSVPQAEFEIFLKLLNPFAPHITEELWMKLGYNTILSKEKWPKFDQKIIDAPVSKKIAIQINGKLRGTITVPPNIDQVTVEKMAKAETNVAKYLTGAPKKVIFVKDKLINFVV